MPAEYDDQPLPTHPEILISDYESISKQIVELSRQRLELKTKIDMAIDSARLRTDAIDDKFREHIAPEATVKDISRGRDF